VSKRNPGLERIPRDFYPTPVRAINPVLGHLEGRTFAEPCCGDGRLAEYLTLAGHFDCGYCGDLSRGQDALEWTSVDGIDFIITNPPHERRVLHRLIEHFIGLERPTWLLIDADWCHTQQAAPYLAHCTTIISIGRVRWMEDTKMDGFDNFCWYGFASERSGETLFVPRKGQLSWF
jgi:hypothetical protein